MAIYATRGGGRGTEMEQVVTFVHVKPVKSRKKILYVGMLERGRCSWFSIPANQ